MDRQHRSGGPYSRPAVFHKRSPVEVFINGRFLSQRLEGVQRTAEETVRALDELLACGQIDGRRWKLSLLAPSVTLREPGLRMIPVRRVGRLRGHAWEQLELPWYSRRGVLVNLCNGAPLLKRAQIATVHDAAVFAAPTAYSAGFAKWYRFMFRLVGRSSEVILTVSEFSRRELIRYLNIPEPRLQVIQQGAQHLKQIEAEESVLERNGLRGARFVLAVGSRNPNKNLDVVLRALQNARRSVPQLVVAGGANERVFRVGDLDRSAASVVYVGYVTDGELKALYESAAALVFPSVYEGFGIPPLEAMSCGCPVVASDIPVLREVCGDAAIYFDPHDPHQLAHVLNGVLTDESLSADLRARGTRLAQAYTWERCARQVWSAVEQVASSGSEAQRS